MVPIKTIPAGLPQRDGTKLLIRILPFETTSTSCDTYYEVRSDLDECLAVGNLHITEEQFTEWGADNSFIEDIVINYLMLERKL